jgi:group I intron endonuclease
MKNLNKFYIYAITNNINNKTYIGQTNNPIYRFKYHKTNYKNKSSALYSAFIKYKIENFTFQIIEEVDTRNEANDAEEFYIQLFRTLAPNGYNLSPGGNCTSPTIQTRIKISNSLKANPNLNLRNKGIHHPRFGHKHSIEIRKQINDQISGEKCTSSKIKNMDAIKIYSLAYLGLSVNQIKKLFPLKSSAIHNIINKKCWKNILKDFPKIINKPKGNYKAKERKKLLEKIIIGEVEITSPIIN